MMSTIIVLLFLAVLVIGGIVLLIALLSNEKTRPVVYALLGVGLVGVLLVGVAGISRVRAGREGSQVHVRLENESEGERSWVTEWVPSRTDRIRDESTNPDISSVEAIDLSIDQLRPPEPPAGDTASPPKDTASPVAESPPKSDVVTDSTSPIATAPMAIKPAWVDQSDVVASDGSYETKVSVGPFQNQLQCAARLDAALVEATGQYIGEFLYQGNRTEFPLRLSLDYIKRHIATGEKYAERTSVRSLDGREMVTLHVRLRFSPEVQQFMKRRQQSAVLTAKLWYTGIGVGLVLTALLAVFGYLKLDTVTKGFYTRRLQFSAGVVILAVVAMGYLLQQGEVVEPLMYGLLPF